MTDHIVRWTPDTCGCVVDLVYRDEVLVATQIVHACGRHRTSHGDDVSAENRRKNAAVNLAAEALSLDPSEARSRLRWTVTDRGEIEIDLQDVDEPPGLAARLTAIGATLRRKGS